jgi:ketosteroid isomerase-like protein
MSSANVELVRSIYDATARGDFSGASWADREIELELVDGPSPGRWVGLPALAEAFSAILNAWQDFRIEAEEFRELDAQRVLVLDRYSGNAKASGISLAQVQPCGATLFLLRDGKVTKMVVYWERDSGLADLGLGPQQ